MPGVWRNVCPLGTTALAPRHLGHSHRLRLSAVWRGRFVLIGVLALLLLVPLRHVVLDLDGPATALTIVVLASVGFVAGGIFEWKSAWCSGLCPVHPVERLYGQEPLISPANAHCRMCERCVATCPDSIAGLHPFAGARTSVERLAGTLMVGGFAGFVWGWFQVPDYVGAEGWRHLGEAYGLPFAGLAAGVVLYSALNRLTGERHSLLLVRAFAAAAVACYYWYRLPALFGFGPFPGDGMLVDLRGTLPEWFPAASRVATTALFGWWLLGKRRRRRSWSGRPVFSPEAFEADSDQPSVRTASVCLPRYMPARSSMLTSRWNRSRTGTSTRDRDDRRSRVVGVSRSSRSGRAPRESTPNARPLRYWYLTYSPPWSAASHSRMSREPPTATQWILIPRFSFQRRTASRINPGWVTGPAVGSPSDRITIVSTSTSRKAVSIDS